MLCIKTELPTYNNRNLALENKITSLFNVVINLSFTQDLTTS